MIQPNELRIGNLFHRIYRGGEVHLPDTSTVFEITAIPLYGVQAVILGEIPAQVEHHAIIEFSDLSPIPFTQEWLWRFGGEMYEVGRWRFRWGNNGQIYVFLHQGYDQYAFHLGEGMDKPIEFVHDFQNFFFALTGQELETVKP